MPHKFELLVPSSHLHVALVHCGAALAVATIPALAAGQAHKHMVVGEALKEVQAVGSSGSKQAIVSSFDRYS
jgi:hypothetical protein